METPLEIGPTEVSYLLGRPGERTCRLIDCQTVSVRCPIAYVGVQHGDLPQGS